MNKKLTVSTESNNSIPVIRVIGEVDLYTVDQLQQAIQDVLHSEVKTLIIDLTDTSYLDSSGLSALLMAYKVLTSRDGILYVVVSASRPAVGRVLEITRLNAVFRICDTIDQAIQEIKISKVA